MTSLDFSIDLPTCKVQVHSDFNEGILSDPYHDLTVTVEWDRYKLKTDSLDEMVKLSIEQLVEARKVAGDPVRAFLTKAIDVINFNDHYLKLELGHDWVSVAFSNFGLED